MSVNGFESLTKLFDTQKVQEILRGINDILNKNSSNAVLVGVTFIWFLFEVLQISLAPLLCHILIFFMLVMFVWSKAAGLIKLSPPSTSDIQLSESTFRLLFEQINWFLKTFYEISCGNDLKLFLMTIASLFAMSYVGNYVTFFTLAYIAILSVRVLPFLYEQNKEQVELVAARTSLDINKAIDQFRSKVLDKIPRATN